MRTRPTGRQLRFGAELRKLRERAGLTATQAGQLLGVKQNQISNMEAGRIGVSLARLRALAGQYDCADKDIVAALGNMTSDRTRGWWEEYREILPAPLLDLAEIEHHARRLRTAVTVHIPGLFQTPEYAREVFRQDVPELSPPDIEHRISFRIKRQAVLFRESPTPHQAVVHEAALRMQFGGPKVTRKQLQHLLGLSEHEHITLQVIPFSAGTIAGSGQSIYYFIGPVPQLDTVNLDQSHGPVFLDAEAQLEKYRVLLGRMEATALDRDGSRDFIHNIARDL
ncbi:MULTISPECIES: helix-turn-helix domain-containing protein [unclassified Streptomyces]|uniref:helix-turn-helix domain-containing protein n=1 Tax=unclassified Streptomyces TaxID=2593676 RepID=UPI00225010D6|nr:MULTISPECIES: helix-turn-helix transcriptional regulator [unclassified Streptomyces]WSP56467.1 helix-turn-helix domain-containing protein [Streptomyces sp. NBC_01241]WSU22815.1 helix-turn-helix domain-containing protein [Streptomyces sp. NBC_01108]MCX4788204.1 helix-turn-helix domain-containing protein [Streptomyces sp. NBC_01221]MCX4796038.1 helix-turn-helix domain-containing protein [Streptomyces sp. NBC_01242]WSJ37305.1 helix-turn-helix domain-containing protein [Streptomyces sp. NBC_013